MTIIGLQFNILCPIFAIGIPKVRSHLWMSPRQDSCNLFRSYIWVMKRQKQKKSILAAGKSVLFDVKTLRLFFSSREFFFSSIWTAKTSLRSVLTTVRSRKRKILSRKRNFAFEFFHLRATSFQPLGTIIPPTRLVLTNTFILANMFIRFSKIFRPTRLFQPPRLSNLPNFPTYTFIPSNSGIQEFRVTSLNQINIQIHSFFVGSKN